MPEDPILDPAAIEHLRFLSPDGGNAFVRELIEIFLQDAPKRCEQLESACAARDAVTASQAAHSIKGSAGNFGAVRLAATCLRIEQLAKAGAVDEVIGAMPDLRREFQSATAELKKELARIA